MNRTTPSGAAILLAFIRKTEVGGTTVHPTTSSTAISRIACPNRSPP